MQKPVDIQDNVVFQKPLQNIAVPNVKNRHQSEEKWRWELMLAKSIIQDLLANLI